MQLSVKLFALLQQNAPSKIFVIATTLLNRKRILTLKFDPLIILINF